MTSASTQPVEPKAWGYLRPNGEVIIPACVEPGDLVRIWVEADLFSDPPGMQAVFFDMRITEVLSRFTATRALAEDADRHWLAPFGRDNVVPLDREDGDAVH